MRPQFISGGVDRNTLLLMPFTGSAGGQDGFYDASVYDRQVTTSGGATIEATDQAGAALGSYADLQGSRYCSVITDPNFDGWYNRDFTIEWWGKRVNAANLSSWWAKGQLVGGTISTRPGFVAVLTTPPANQWRITRDYGLAGSRNDNIAAITDTNWHHFAITREGDDYNAFLDGTLVYSDTLAQTLLVNTQPFHVGASTAIALSPVPNTGNCFIDDLRISQVVRYREDFTPPGPHKR